MNPIRFIPFLLISLLLPATLHAVDFVHQVMPVLKQHCAECHTGDKKKGGLAMNTRAELLAGGENGAVVKPGDAKNSLFIQLAGSADDEEWMPPKGPRVPAKDLAVLAAWVDAGLPWEAGITLGASNWEPPLKPRVVELPPARGDRTHPIDRLLDADLARRKQQPPPPASDAAFLRRATLDVTGLLPSPETMQAFLANPASDKRTQRIDQLLEDDVAYADHWLTTWNDLLRNDYTGTGFITGGRKQITTWLYNALRENKPYDRFVRELISPTEESAGFIKGIKWRGEVNASQTPDIQFAQNISQVFLGINMKCASCHDSFIDRWTLEEAYNLAAIYSDKPLELNRCDKPTGQIATPKWIFPELGEVDAKASKNERLKQLAGLMTHPENGRFTRTVVNRLWHRLMGRGIVHPVDAMHTQPWNEDLLDYLAVRFAEDGYDLRGFIRFVMTSQAYQSRSVILEKEPGEDYVYTGPIAKRMTAEQLIDSIWQITGTHPAKAAVELHRSNTKELPKAEVSTVTLPPITAKWIWHDGKDSQKAELRRRFKLAAAPKQAIVRATCDNAFTMTVNGAQVAASRDWQKPLQFDIAKHLVAGTNQIEVSAEMWGGAAGFVAQVVMDGRVLETDAAWEVRKPKGKWAAAVAGHAHGSGPWGNILESKTHAPPADGRGGPPIRAALVKNDFLMRSLGRPHRDQVVTTRPGELTTLQAIDLANGDILSDYLGRGAKKLAGKNASGTELVDWLYHFALTRPPTEQERSVLTKVAGDARDPVAVEDLLWLVLMQPEFQIIR